LVAAATKGAGHVELVVGNFQIEWLAHLHLPHRSVQSVGIVVEGLVKVAEAEEDNGIGELFLDAVVLLLKGCHHAP
jgi:hypothetical protein